MNCITNIFQADIRENEIFEQLPDLLSILLMDRTLSSENCQVNIFGLQVIMLIWALDISMAIKLH